MQQQQPQPQQTTVARGEGRAETRRILDSRGFDNRETFAGGEEAWGLWSWKLKVATRAMSQDLVELMNHSEARHGKSTEEILEAVDDIDVNEGRGYDKSRC